MDELDALFAELLENEEQETNRAYYNPDLYLINISILQRMDNEVPFVLKDYLATQIIDNIKRMPNRLATEEQQAEFFARELMIAALSKGVELGMIKEGAVVSISPKPEYHMVGRTNLIMGFNPDGSSIPSVELIALTPPVNYSKRTFIRSDAILIQKAEYRTMLIPQSKAERIIEKSSRDYGFDVLEYLPSRKLNIKITQSFNKPISAPMTHYINNGGTVIVGGVDVNGLKVKEVYNNVRLNKDLEKIHIRNQLKEMINNRPNMDFTSSEIVAMQEFNNRLTDIDMQRGYNNGKL